MKLIVPNLDNFNHNQLCSCSEAALFLSSFFVTLRFNNSCSFNFALLHQIFLQRNTLPRLAVSAKCRFCTGNPYKSDVGFNEL